MCRDTSPARGSAATEDVLQNDSPERQARVHRTYFSPSPRTSDLHRVVLIFFFRILGLLVGRLLLIRVCVARTWLLRCSKKFSSRKASVGALSRIVRAALISRQFGHSATFLTSVGCGKFCLSYFCFGCLSCSALAKSAPHLRLPNSPRTSVCVRKTSPSCVLLCFMYLALALSFPEQMATTPTRERLKLGLRLPTTRSKLSL